MRFEVPGGVVERDKRRQKIRRMTPLFTSCNLDCCAYPGRRCLRSSRSSEYLEMTELMLRGFTFPVHTGANPLDRGIKWASWQKSTYCTHTERTFNRTMTKARGCEHSIEPLIAQLNTGRHFDWNYAHPLDDTHLRSFR